MFGPAGHAYVYRSYGVHWCFNAVCEAAGVGAAVLVRALEPTHGLGEMHGRRGVGDDRLLCAGPGRLTEALGISGAHDGLPLDRPPFALLERAGAVAVERSPRIGITRAAELPWRYSLAGSAYVSRRPRPPAPAPGPRSARRRG
jgi:DNA-3-methyladenine glycosylase